MPVTGGASEQGTDVPGPQSAVLGGSLWCREFRGDERELGEVRRWLSSLLPDCPARYDVACVATELGTNASAP